MSSKNSNQSPLSNTNRICKQWKISFEKHKTTNSLIFEDHHRATHIGLSPKNSKNFKETNSSKFQTMHRHSSEEDFKKYFGLHNAHQAYSPEPMPASSEQEYYSLHGPTASTHFGNNLRVNDKFLRFYPKIPQKQKQNTGIHIKNNALKQTSSTQSAQNLGLASQIFSNRNQYRALQNTPVSPSHTQKNPPLSAKLKKIRLQPTPRNNIKRDSFKIICKLGQGKFGKVFMVKQINSGFVLAMKIIQKKRIIQDRLLDQFIRQIKIQSFLNHPNIISMYGFFQDETHFYILMEFGCDGQLYSLIANNRLLSQQATSFIIKNLLDAVAVMHTNQVLHRDIKPENIVLVMGNVKLCDFGWATNKIHPGDLRNTFCGTPLYLSPQILQGCRYDEKVDLWAIGVMAYQLIFGTSPFDISGNSDLQKIITQDITFPKQVSFQFREFITAMLTKDPKQRLSSKKLLELDFVFKYQQMETCQQLCK